MCTPEIRNGHEVTIACGNSSTCSSSTTSTSQVLGSPTFDKNQDPNNPLTSNQK